MPPSQVDAFFMRAWTHACARTACHPATMAIYSGMTISVPSKQFRRYSSYKIPGTQTKYLYLVNELISISHSKAWITREQGNCTLR